MTKKEIRAKKINKNLMDLFHLYQDGDFEKPIEATLTLLNMKFKLTFSCELIELMEENK